MKIIVDAMGGDNAPQAVVEGAVAAAKELGVDIVLVGKQEIVEALVKKNGGDALGGKISIVNATEVVDMAEAIMNLQHAETVNQAVLQTASKSIKQSLFDFLG